MIQQIQSKEYTLGNLAPKLQHQKLDDQKTDWQKLLRKKICAVKNNIQICSTTNLLALLHIFKKRLGQSKAMHGTETKQEGKRKKKVFAHCTKYVQIQTNMDKL